MDRKRESFERQNRKAGLSPRMDPIDLILYLEELPELQARRAANSGVTITSKRKPRRHRAVSRSYTPGSGSDPPKKQATAPATV